MPAWCPPPQPSASQGCRVQHRHSGVGCGRRGETGKDSEGLSFRKTAAVTSFPRLSQRLSYHSPGVLVSLLPGPATVRSDISAACRGSSGLLCSFACTPCLPPSDSPLGLVWVTRKMLPGGPAISPPTPITNRSTLATVKMFIKLGTSLESKRRRQTQTHLSVLQALPLTRTSVTAFAPHTGLSAEAQHVCYMS